VPESYVTLSLQNASSKAVKGQHITTRCHRMARKVITMKSIAIRSDNYKKFASFNCKEIASFNSKMGIIEMIFLDSFLRKTYNFGSYLQICEAQSDSIAGIQPRKQYIAQRGLRSDSPEGPKDEGNLMVTLLPFGQEVNMKSGFHSATTTTADLQTDVTASAHAGFKTLELWLAKVDRFPLKIFPFIYACLKLFMHVSNILAMMAPIPSNYFAPNIGLGILCN
jgi:hypothetical protein